MQVIAVASGKGGTGKSTTAHILAHELSHAMRVLAVDFDPQGSLTTMMGAPGPGPTMADVINPATRAPLHTATRQMHPRLHVAPSAPGLANAEMALHAMRAGRELVLRRALATVASAYDVCVIDCPPATGLLVANALAAAQGVLVPVQPEALSIGALAAFLEAVDDVRQAVNPALATIGAVVTFHNSQSTHHADALAALRARVQVLAVVGRSVHLADAALTHKPLTETDPNSPRADEYRTLTKAVTQWLKNQT